MHADTSKGGRRVPNKKGWKATISYKTNDMVCNATHIACHVCMSGPGNYQVRDVDVPRPKLDVVRKATGMVTWPDVSKLRRPGENTIKLAADTEPEESPRVRETVPSLTMPGDAPPPPHPNWPLQLVFGSHSPVQIDVVQTDRQLEFGRISPVNLPPVLTSTKLSDRRKDRMKLGVDSTRDCGQF